MGDGAFEGWKDIEKESWEEWAEVNGRNLDYGGVLGIVSSVPIFLASNSCLVLC